jgi:hypothetical protein
MSPHLREEALEGTFGEVLRHGINTNPFLRLFSNHPTLRVVKIPVAF